MAPKSSPPNTSDSQCTSRYIRSNATSRITIVATGIASLRARGHGARRCTTNAISPHAITARTTCPLGKLLASGPAPDTISVMLGPSAWATVRGGPTWWRFALYRTSSTCAATNASTTQASAPNPPRIRYTASASMRMLVSSRPPSSAMAWNNGCNGSLHTLDIACSTCLSRSLNIPAATAIVRATYATATTTAATSRALSTCTDSRSALAMAAEDGAASRDADNRQRAPACEARFAGPTVDEKQFLLVADITPRVAIRVDRAAAIANRNLERIAQRFVQPANRFSAEASRNSIGPEFRAMQRLVGVDVAHAGYRALVEQDRFQRRAPAPKTPEQLIGVKRGVDRLGPKLRQCAGCQQLVLRAEQQTPKPPRVAISQLPAIVEVEDCMRVVRDLARGFDQTELAAHAQVNDEQAPFTKRDEDELPAPSNGLDRQAGDGVDEDLGLGMPDDRRKAQVAAHDRPADEVRPQVGDDGLDFRKLRHQSPSPRRGEGRQGGAVSWPFRLEPPRASSCPPSSGRPWPRPRCRSRARMRRS